MRSVFADTAYWIALVNPHDQLNVQAKRASSALANVRIVTSEIVFTELLNHFAEGGPSLRTTAADVVMRLRTNKNVAILPWTSSGFTQALLMYRSRIDKGWSLTDCFSFNAMLNNGIDSALTADRHFEQAGFKALLRA